MLPAILMLHELQVILEGQIAAAAIESRAAAPLAHPGARGHQHGFAHVGRDVEPVGSVRGCGGGGGAVVDRGVVFVARGFGFGACGAFGFDERVPCRGFGGVFGPVPGAPEGGVGGFGGGGGGGHG